MEKLVNERLNNILTLLQKKIETHLALCESPEEKMVLLSYFQSILEEQTARWFSFQVEDKPGPYFQLEGDEWMGKFYPSTLCWYDVNNMKIRNFTEPVEFELYPQYPVKDEFKKVDFKIDFAFFYPRTDGRGEKIKVAIECNGHKYQKQPKENMTPTEKDRYLQSKGWLVARFTGTEIQKSDIYDLIGEVEKIAMNKDYELFHETEKHRIKWELN